MYIVKNALRNITRAKGRNILIGCIAFVIGLSACLALSIQEAADRERESGLSNLNITASIRVDRQSMMEDMRQNTEGNEESDGSRMKDKLSAMKELSLEELKTYAKAESVQDFYYTESVSLNASSIEAVSRMHLRQMQLKKAVSHPLAKGWAVCKIRVILRLPATAAKRR